MTQSSVQTPRKILTKNAQIAQKNIYFVNFIVLATLLALFIIGCFCYVMFLWEGLMIFSSQLFTVYTILFSLMQMNAFLEPFIVKHYETEQSLAAIFSIVLACFVIIVPILSMTKIFWCAQFILNLLCGFILFSNAISIISKKYREGALTFWTNVGYLAIALFFPVVSMMTGLESTATSFLIITVYAISNLLKSLTNQPEFIKTKPESSESIFTVIMAGISFFMVISFFMWETLQVHAIADGLA